MNSIQALVILLVVFAFGEIVAAKTKAILSTTLVISVILLIGFWIGLPADIFSIAQIDGVAGVLIGILITSMGTMLDIPELIRQWKTVLIGFFSVVVGVGAIIFIGSPIIGRQMAIAGAPIFAGANVATLIMTTALNEMGLPKLASFAVLVLVTQNFVGIPISSILLRREAKNFRMDPNNIKTYLHSEESSGEEEKAVKRKMLQLPESFNKPSVIITKVAVVAMIANYLSQLTNGKVHYFVVALLLGVFFTRLGFLERDILGKTESSGFIIFSTTMIIFATLAQTTPSLLLSMLGPLILSLGLGSIAVIVFGILISKPLNISPYLAICLGLTCTFGFPTTMLMSEEVAEAMGRNDDEKTAIRNYILPKMLTAGFVTVTISSVLITGVVVGLL